jgi:hypothetical protein
VCILGGTFKDQTEGMYRGTTPLKLMILYIELEEYFPSVV